MKQTPDYSSWKNWDRAPASTHEWETLLLTSYDKRVSVLERIVEIHLGE